ncbi:MAG: exonuclease [Chloroflexi bacterium]|nr:exonuclease [Chloroflexota bacterium]
MPVRITGYDGVGVIGGNKILLEDEERRTKLFLDFGMSFSRRSEFFEEYLKPRPGVGLRDPLRLDLLPPLEGIYRSDLAAALSADDLNYLRSQSHYRQVAASEIQGVYLSHAHLDHSGYISFLHEDIPIFCTAMTATVAKVVQDAGQSGDIEREVCYFVPREKNKEGLLASPKGAAYYGRPFVVVDDPEFTNRQFWGLSPASGRKIDLHNPGLPIDRIGDLALRFQPVDHSIYGATACAVETSAGWVVYSGDLRFHGKRGPSLEALASWARALEPVALICEGTRIDAQQTAPRLTEESVKVVAWDLAKRYKGLIIADFAARNVDRLLAFREIAQSLGRRLAITPGDAYLLDAMRQVDASLPDVAQDATAVIFADVKSAPRTWERGVRKKYEGKLVRAADVRRQPQGFILAFSFFDINDLVDIDLLGDLSDAVYIYSSSEAFNEELQIDINRLGNWLRYFNLKFIGNPLNPEREPGLHVSGHAGGADLLELVRQVHPRNLIPIHSTKPELFQVLEKEGISVIMPQPGRPIVF